MNYFRKKADQADRQKNRVNQAELDDTRDPEILDPVFEAKLILQCAGSRRVGTQQQFTPVEMR